MDSDHAFEIKIRIKKKRLLNFWLNNSTNINKCSNYENIFLITSNIPFKLQVETNKFKIEQTISN